MLYTVKCPKCGAVQKGLNLKETEGSVVCNKCDTKFEVDIEKLNEQKKKEETAE